MDIKLSRGFLQAPTIRMLVLLWAGSILGAWILMAGGWFVAKAKLSAITNRVVLDMKALSEAREMESDILAHKREHLLWEATGRTEYRDRSWDHLQTAERIGRSLDAYVSTPREQELAAQIQSRLRFLHESWQAEPAGHAGAETSAETRWIDDLLAAVDEFQGQNEDQMNESIQAAAHVHMLVSRGMVGLSLGTAVLLSAGALGLIRRVIRPTLSLTAAARAFGQGDFATQAAVLHDDELGSLARTFNNMAGDIADRERNRLQFVAMVVHDLKNPVLAVEMAARMLRRPDLTEEQRRTCLEGITEEVAHLRGIIRDLMDDIQVANGRFSIHQAEVDLGALVRQFTQAQSRAFAGREIAVTTDEGCVIQGDARRIERVVMNLLSNAVKYSPPHTRVSVYVRKEDTQAVLAVSDQGPGIAEDDLAVLFQPFGRGRSADALAEGTGMGLYVVKQIVEAHGGRIDVHSELGHGATFRVRLPLTRR